MGGYDSDLNALIETMDTSVSMSAPSVIRTLAGANTGIYPMTTGDFSHNAMSMAVDSDTGELYVYSYSASSVAQKISVFARGASGNVAPAQIISDSTLGATTVGAAGIGVRSCSCH